MHAHLQSNSRMMCRHWQSGGEKPPIADDAKKYSWMDFIKTVTGLTDPFPSGSERYWLPSLKVGGEIIPMAYSVNFPNAYTFFLSSYDLPAQGWTLPATPTKIVDGVSYYQVETRTLCGTGSGQDAYFVKNALGLYDIYMVKYCGKDGASDYDYIKTQIYKGYDAPDSVYLKDYSLKQIFPVYTMTILESDTAINVKPVDMVSHTVWAPKSLGASAFTGGMDGSADNLARIYGWQSGRIVASSPFKRDWVSGNVPQMVGYINFQAYTMLSFSTDTQSSDWACPIPLALYKDYGKRSSTGKYYAILWELNQLVPLTRSLNMKY